jgi:phosphatidylserine/phosphatidylglycerophosphate/cardiolipin synthase-like enzyme
MTHYELELSQYLAEGLHSATKTATCKPSTETSADWATRLAEIAAATYRESGEAALAENLHEGIKCATARLDWVSLAVTGMAWLGGGLPAVERTFAELVASAEREILVTVYSVTLGSERIWQEIDKCLATGVRCRLVVNELHKQDSQALALIERLAKRYQATFELFNFEEDDERGGLHAKILVVDRSVALIGSANLSHRGLVTAHEMAIVVRGPTVEMIAAGVDRLLRSHLIQRVGVDV